MFFKDNCSKTMFGPCHRVSPALEFAMGETPKVLKTRNSSHVSTGRYVS